MEYSYKFRLYPTKAQEQQIQRTFGCCRYLFIGIVFIATLKY